MPNSSSEIISQTIAISTIFLLIVGAFATRYVFLYQRKRFTHQQEMNDLKDAFNKTLMQSKLEIQEQTLDHIAKELHDNVGQLASLVQIGLEELSLQTTGKTRENALETRLIAAKLFGELRTLGASFNSDYIMHIGLANALNNELTRLGKAKNYKTTFTKTGQEYRLEPGDEIILFRLCQEVLNNIVKYADATVITVIINYLPELFSLSIADNGIGFDVAQALAQSAEKESTGLINIQKRAKLINAAISIESAPGNGAKFIIDIPKKENQQT
jgi:signal transduction histidine kinase